MQTIYEQANNLSRYCS